MTGLFFRASLCSHQLDSVIDFHLLALNFGYAFSSSSFFYLSFSMLLKHCYFCQHTPEVEGLFHCYVAISLNILATVNVDPFPYAFLLCGNKQQTRKVRHFVWSFFFFGKDCLVF